MICIELVTTEKTKFLLNLENGWEIHDRGSEPAQWVSPDQRIDLNCSDTYEEIKRDMLDSKRATLSDQ